MCRFLAVVVMTIALPLTAEDWPQFLGPARNGVYSGGDLAATWPASGPPMLWKRDAGAGFSGPVVAQGRLIFFYRAGNRVTIEAMEAKTGRKIWATDSATNYRDDFGFDEGPRAAPVISGGKIYTFDAEGVLQALDFATGRRLWSVATRDQFRAPKGFFG